MGLSRKILKCLTMKNNSKMIELGGDCGFSEELLS